MPLDKPTHAEGVGRDFGSFGFGERTGVDGREVGGRQGEVFALIVEHKVRVVAACHAHHGIFGQSRGGNAGEAPRIVVFDVHHTQQRAGFCTRAGVAVKRLRQGGERQAGRGDGVAVGVEKRIAQERRHAFAFARIEAVFHVVGPFVPLRGGIARVFGEILLIDAVGAHQRQGVAAALGGEGDGIGRDGDAPLEHQSAQGLGGGGAVEPETAKEGFPRRAREVAPRFEQGFEEILGAFVATVVLSPREVAPQAGEEGFHDPETEKVVGDGRGFRASAAAAIRTDRVPVGEGNLRLSSRGGISRQAGRRSPIYNKE